MSGRGYRDGEPGAPDGPVEPPAGPSTRERGREGEEEGVRWLLDQGYLPVERNLTNEAGEIDLIARDGDTLCFVEIKARLSDSFGPAIEAVGPGKQRRLSRTAVLYLAQADLGDVACRFDVLGLDWIGGAWEYTLVRDAFPFRGSWS